MLGRRTGVRLLLVDDQYRLGYHLVLAGLLSGRPAAGGDVDGGWKCSLAHDWSLQCAATPEPLLSPLRRLSPPVDWNKPRSIDVGADVVLLDLRLWTGSGKRREVLKDLTAICDRLDVRVLEAKDDHFKKALKAAQGALGGDAGGDLDALALLPLLLSHADPSLPVVVFSSTQQRRVVEALSHRPNLITEFSKPIPTGYADQGCRGGGAETRRRHPESRAAARVPRGVARGRCHGRHGKFRRSVTRSRSTGPRLRSTSIT